MTPCAHALLIVFAGRGLSPTAGVLADNLIYYRAFGNAPTSKAAAYKFVGNGWCLANHGRRIDRSGSTKPTKFNAEANWSASSTGRRDGSDPGCATRCSANATCTGYMTEAVMLGIVPTHCAIIRNVVPVSVDTERRVYCFRRTATVSTKSPTKLMSPPPPPPPTRRYKKIFDGQCDGPAYMAYYKSNTPTQSPGRTPAGRVRYCAIACLNRTLKGGAIAKGFSVSPVNGVCWCESADSSTCKRALNAAADGYDRFDFIAAGATERLAKCPRSDQTSHTVTRTARRGRLAIDSPRIPSRPPSREHCHAKSAAAVTTKTKCVQPPFLLWRDPSTQILVPRAPQECAVFADCGA